jgi:ferredoxin-NADP reductase
MGEWDVRYLGSRLRAPGTRTFAFERPEGLDYLPGQFFFVLLRGPEGSGVAPMEHHFSFSSSPTELNVEFTTRMTGHEYKNRLDALTAGATVHIAGPDGAFVLEPSMRNVAFVCAGIGITPARSTIRWAVDTRADVDIVLLYGNRNLESVAFREELDELDSRHVHVVHVLSQPAPGWDGPAGHIDADVVRGHIADWADRDFFVSGPGEMVDGVVRMLVDEVGVAPERVYSEHFPGYSSSAT